MMKTSVKRIGAVLFLGLLLAGALSGARAGGSSLDELAWMTGSWAGEEGAIRAEEHWIAPAGGLMLGLHRDVARGKAVSFEFLRIESRPEGIVYLASPQGAAATPFRLVESKGKRAVFENPAHDFPKRILYWLAGDGSLHARVEGAPGEEKKAQEWVWRPATGAGR
jgi:hypothetical protein